ncbi:MAG: co-chaperone GroES [Acidobacteria bacterium]|nr:co-chaperone GroES [Acidobacteriota bacterium]TDI50686.1 MAG: co-chaperone GroES [Acidobacteriota bacterium]TDI57564.1 MAG: co-chaperone GroES [Acidobacteriota bacterium]
MQLQPLGDRVVVTSTDDAESRTPSGLVIPDTAKEKPQIGEVVAVGPGARDDDGERIPMDVSVGDNVLYSKFSGTEIKLDMDDFLVLSERDILAIVK